jgi:Trk K+ transport system NAD-binding subunit
VDSFIDELASRNISFVIVVDNEDQGRKLSGRHYHTVYASLSDEHDLDLSPVVEARAIVANARDEDDATLAMRARELGFNGPLIALIDNPNRRAPMQMAGATTAFTPNHVLAAVAAVRASDKIGPRITGVQPLKHHLEIAEIRIHNNSPLNNKTPTDPIWKNTGAHIVAQWKNNALLPGPGTGEYFKIGMILVAAGTPDSIRRISEISHPITKQGPIVVVGYGDVGNKLVEMLQAAGETVCVVASEEVDGVDVVGDILDTDVYDHADVLDARVVILTCEDDNTSVLASTVIRNYAPDVPIIACTQLEESVGRSQQAGVDFAVSVSEVSGQLLAHHILGDMVSQQTHVKLVRLAVGNLAGSHPSQTKIHDRTGCTIIGIVRKDTVIIDFPESFKIEESDDIYICGLTGSFDSLYREIGIN